MKILIVDDSKLNRAFAQDYILNSDIESELMFAANGYEALDIIKEVDVDIVLLDIVMPELDGIETLKELDRQGYHDRLKVIMYSSTKESDKLKLCFELGAVDFIRKPIEEVEFISRLKSTMKQTENEKELKRYIDEIEQQKSIIMSTNLQLIQSEKMAGIGHLAAGVAHEINNPMGFISSNFEVLKDYIYHFIAFYDLMNQTAVNYEPLKSIISSFDQKFKMYEIFDDLTGLYDETRTGLVRVTKIVQSLRNFANLDSNQEFEMYSINDGIEDTLIIANSYIKYNAILELNLGDIPNIMALSQQMNQVILNILMNAVDAIVEKQDPDAKRIVITTYQLNDTIKMIIKDEGKGIQLDHIKSLYNPFFTTKSVGSGIGLGLSIAYDIIVNKHKGTIEITSDEGEWSQVEVTLPITQ